MINQGQTTHDEVITRLTSAPWGAFFRPSSQYAPAVSETIKIIARGPSDVVTAKMPRARSLLSGGMPKDVIGFSRCDFVEAVKIFCYLGTWSLAMRSKSLTCEKHIRGGFVDPRYLSDLSGVQEGTIKHALSAFCADKAVQMIRAAGGREMFRCDVGFLIT